MASESQELTDWDNAVQQGIPTVWVCLSFRNARIPYHVCCGPHPAGWRNRHSFPWREWEQTDVRLSFVDVSALRLNGDAHAFHGAWAGLGARTYALHLQYRTGRRVVNGSRLKRLQLSTENLQNLNGTKVDESETELAKLFFWNALSQNLILN